MSADILLLVEVRVINQGTQLDRFMNAREQRLLALALRLIASSPSRQGAVTITVMNGHINLIRPEPSLRFFDADIAGEWLENIPSTPTE